MLAPPVLKIVAPGSREMTRAEFIAKYRSRLLLLATDAWAIRKDKPSDIGQALDMHLGSLKGLLEDIYKDLCPELDEAQRRNGRA